jgi:DNA-binding MarR family transcriptional regulator
VSAAKERALEVLADFAAIYLRFHALERVPRDFGTGDLLCPAEIHTVEFVGSNPDCRPHEGSARELAVTRGAVSQMIRRLTSKGYLLRRTSGEEPVAARLRLTSRGKTALAGHRELHRNIGEKFLRHVGPLSAAQVERVRGITRRIIRELDEELGRQR